jgi:hypothetical protein
MSNRTHKIILCAAALVCAAAVLPGRAAAAPPYQYDPSLSAWVRASLEQATFIQGTMTKQKPVYVRCYSNWPTFEAPLLREGDTWRETESTIAYSRAARS